PVELVPHLVDLNELAASRPDSHYLFPCRAGAAGPASSVSYLDEIPERVPWTLVGCARSKSIHDWFYGGDVPMVDMCPRRLAENGSALTGNGLRPGSLPVITKCCLLEDRVGQEAGLVVVPWGASLAQIREGLRLALTAGRSADPVPP
ncbi:MAG TPA: hypothetical protein VG123_41150, partial [Streptosporangiaceae bacterium]|nr:hypothetical protein [Streptosporangiaceae bacterium]